MHRRRQQKEQRKHEYLQRQKEKAIGKKEYDRRGFYFIVKIKIHSSCEIEDFVETQLCKLCVILPDRAYYWVCVLIKDIGRRLPLELQCSLYQGQQGDVNMWRMFVFCVLSGYFAPQTQTTSKESPPPFLPPLEAQK